MTFIDATIKTVNIKWLTNIMQEEIKLKKDMQCFEFLE